MRGFICSLLPSGALLRPECHEWHLPLPIFLFVVSGFWPSRLLPLGRLLAFGFFLAQGPCPGIAVKPPKVGNNSLKTFNSQSPVESLEVEWFGKGTGGDSLRGGRR